MNGSRALRVRLSGLLLAAVVAAANLGLPAADALLDHQISGSSQSAKAHLESLNGCWKHPDHCPLGRMLGAVLLQAPAGSTAPLTPALHRPAVHPTPVGVLLARHHPSYFSRAPPQPA
jgi:hypothetical protein